MKHDKEQSYVRITYLDGGFETHTIDASIAIASYIAKQASASGSYSFWSKEKSIIIPVANIYKIEFEKVR